MLIPCKNCLVYPACRNRAKVDCEILMNYIEKEWPTFQLTSHYLPHLQTILALENKPPKEPWKPVKRIAYLATDENGLIVWRIMDCD